MTAPSPNEGICRMMSDCHLDTIKYDENCYHVETMASSNCRNFDIIENDQNQMMPKENFVTIESDQSQMMLDKVKAESWKNHDSMHTTTRTGNCLDDEYRRWYSLDSIHSMKAENSQAFVEGIKGRNTMSILPPENDMQGSNSDYNDSLCSFASFGEASSSDNMDIYGNHSFSGNGRVDPYQSKKSIHLASMEFTKSFDNEENPSCSLMKQTHLLKSASYRGCANSGLSLSQIRESLLD
jgi:hypothetical protein